MKKIRSFETKCKKLGIPLLLIIKLEKLLKEFKGKIYIVGGNVRDLILNESSKTHPDLVVNIELSKLIFCLKKEKIKFLRIGEEYGSLVVLIKKFKFDFTCMRKDVETDGRWAKIKFTKDLVEDSKRRDFTINSIYCDTNGNLYDPNDGIKDLLNKRIRFIGDANKRIKEDYLRVLRYFRFSLLISGDLENNNFKICQKYFSRLTNLSFERRIQEIKKIILTEKIEDKVILKSLKKLFEYTLDSKLNFNNFTDLCFLESSLKNKSFERRIKFLLRDKSRIPQFFNKNANNSFKSKLISKMNFKNYSIKELNLKLYKSDKDNTVDQILFDYVDNKISKKKFEEVYNFCINFKKRKIPLTGNDLLKIGFKPGKKMGEALKKLEYFWIDRNFMCTRNECVKFIEKFLP